TADVSELEAALDQLRAQDINLRIVFLEASDEVLIRRFEATPRPPPVAGEGRGRPSRSRSSATCCASCAPTPTWWSTPATSTCTSCGPRSWPRSPTRRPALRARCPPSGFCPSCPLTSP